MKKVLHTIALKKSDKGLYCLILILFLGLFTAWSIPLQAQDPPQYGTPFNNVPDARDVNMYQVHLRPFSAAGNFAGVTARLDSIRALGINVLYLMPFYPVGQDNRSSNSPYCVKDFTGIAPEYGTLTDLRALVDGAHSRGMAVMIDWIANQTSWDHDWITQYPERYVRDGNGVVQPLNPFPDVAALNFANSGMRTAMINAMRYWVFAANIDGFRCDFANNAPLDFWQQAITNLRGISGRNLLFFAEGDRLENFQVGFDLNFGDKWYYDAIMPIANGGNVSQIQQTTNVEYTYAAAHQQVVRYTANHDTENGTTALNVFGGHNGVVVNFMVSAYMRGVPFLTSGQEVDFNQTIPWPYTTVKINWNANQSASADFKKILNFRTASTAIRRGSMTNYSNTDICAFTKVQGTEKVVVIANMRNQSRTYQIPSALAGTYVNVFNNNSSTTLTATNTITLGAFQYLVLTNANVPNVPVTGVTVNPTTLTLQQGLTSAISATIVPSNATNQTVNWTSSNNAIATVDATGKVTAVAIGTATITATTVDQNRTATTTVTVQAPTSFTVHFNKPVSWGSTVRIYWWSAQPGGILTDGSWPGVTMTSDGNGWYSYTFTNITATNLIFNDGTAQTANLNRDKDGWYMNGTWYDSFPGNPAPVYYHIENRWQAGRFLYDNGNGTVQYGTNPGNNTAYQWIQEDAGNGYVLLKNRNTGRYMHLENQNGSVQCGNINTSWYSAQWTIASAGSGWNYLQNRWNGSQWINIENLTGNAQYTGSQAGWHSAMWRFVAVSSSQRTATTTLQNELIQKEIIEQARIYPNPSTDGQFYVELPSALKGTKSTLTIYDGSGRLFHQQELTSSSRINHSLKPGWYMITIRYGNYQETQKLLIR
ncbi:alpha-amylase family glycosyl hydrolase [Gynurincola endophyticus]|uniref:alpha-amylase family glycosyl hydrolase n=1 Tax=Gynurincola endophyticus TaxID=2479004 RepID=UPI000F8D5196|nr:alpha-amylase family glycosyl hydrolase [Gynurincola endophyticus]